MSEVLQFDMISDSTNEIVDQEINCIDCKEVFIWTTGEQIFFRDKNLENPPKRCKPCKKAKNVRLEAIQNGKAKGRQYKIEVAIRCVECNEPTTVPFFPSQGRPVYCRTCFQAQSRPVSNSATTN